MGNPVAHDAISEIAARAGTSGVNNRRLVYNSPRPLMATIEIAQTHEIGLLVFGSTPREYGRIRYRLHARRLRRPAQCLVWPLE
jgi:hypothetical protein